MANANARDKHNDDLPSDIPRLEFQFSGRANVYCPADPPSADLSPIELVLSAGQTEIETRRETITQTTRKREHDGNDAEIESRRVEITKLLLPEKWLVSELNAKAPKIAHRIEDNIKYRLRRKFSDLSLNCDVIVEIRFSEGSIGCKGEVKIVDRAKNLLPNSEFSRTVVALVMTALSLVQGLVIVGPLGPIVNAVNLVLDLINVVIKLINVPEPTPSGSGQLAATVTAHASASASVSAGSTTANTEHTAPTRSSYRHMSRDLIILLVGLIILLAIVFWFLVALHLVVIVP